MELESLLRDHIAVILVNCVIFASVVVNIDLVQLMINLGLEIRLYHHSALLSCQFLGESEQKLVFVALNAFI